MIDAAEAKAEEMSREAYSVRSASEEGRRNVVSAVREMLERKCWETDSKRNRNDKGNKKKTKKGHFFGEHVFRGDKKSSVGVGLEYEGAKSVEDENKALLRSVLDSQYDKLENNRAGFLRELEAALSSPSAVAGHI